jgi:hypothetical protein
MSNKISYMPTLMTNKLMVCLGLAVNPISHNGHDLYLMFTQHSNQGATNSNTVY